MGVGKLGQIRSIYKILTCGSAPRSNARRKHFGKPVISFLSQVVKPNGFQGYFLRSLARLSDSARILGIVEGAAPARKRGWNQRKLGTAMSINAAAEAKILFRKV